MRMLQATGDRINPRGVSVRLFCHPAAFFAMHETTSVADQQYRWLGGPWPVPGKPAATAAATDHQSHRDARVAVSRDFGGQWAIASPAPLCVFFLIHLGNVLSFV
jgi:hypothetical protein